MRGVTEWGIGITFPAPEPRQGISCCVPESCWAESIESTRESTSALRMKLRGGTGFAWLISPSATSCGRFNNDKCNPMTVMTNQRCKNTEKAVLSSEAVPSLPPNRLG